MNAREKAFRETMSQVVKNLQLPNSPSKMSPAVTHTISHSTELSSR